MVLYAKRSMRTSKAAMIILLVTSMALPDTVAGTFIATGLKSRSSSPSAATRAEAAHHDCSTIYTVPVACYYALTSAMHSS